MASTAGTYTPFVKRSLGTKVQQQTKPQPPNKSVVKGSSLVSVREPPVKKVACGPEQNREMLGGRDERRATGIAGADGAIAPQEALANLRSSFETPTARTRAGLARVLKSILEPLNRVNGLSSHPILWSLILKCSSDM